MKLWNTSIESKLDRQRRIHEELLEESKKLAEAAAAQKETLVAAANGHLVKFQEVLGGTDGTRKSSS